jgi:antitoxin component of RelBE/YafQ-DinJ toxin-antitoxin module
MGQKNVTLSIDENIYHKYKRFCKKYAIALSRSIEIFMENKIKKEEK